MPLPTRIAGTWLPADESSSSQITASSDGCVVKAAELRIVGTCCCSHESPVETAQSCMSLHMFGVMKA